MNNINSSKSFFNYLDQNNEVEALKALETLDEKWVKYKRPDTRDTLLHAAIRKNLTELAIQLLERGANPYATNIVGEMPFCLAMEKEKKDSESLISAMIVRTEKMTNTLERISSKVGQVILKAATEDNIALIRSICLVVDKVFLQDVLIKWRFVGGNTLLHVAVAKQKNDLVKLLIKYGIDPKVKNHEEKSVLDLARETNNPDILSLLESSKKTNPYEEMRARTRPSELSSAQLQPKPSSRHFSRLSSSSSSGSKGSSRAENLKMAPSKAQSPSKVIEDPVLYAKISALINSNFNSTMEPIYKSSPTELLK